MKRILICLLLLANLSSGLVFAWDTHPEAMVGHDFAAVELVGDGHEHPDGDLHHDDHSCHAAAHLMGIVTTDSTSLIETGKSYRLSMMATLSSLYITPLLRPPIV